MTVCQKNPEQKCHCEPAPNPMSLRTSPQTGVAIPKSIGQSHKPGDPHAQCTHRLRMTTLLKPFRAPKARYQPKPPLCKGRWHDKAVTEGLCGKTQPFRRNTGEFATFPCTTPQSASLTAPLTQGSLPLSSPLPIPYSKSSPKAIPHLFTLHYSLFTPLTASPAPAAPVPW